MPKQISSLELETILTATSSLPSGGSLEEIDRLLQSASPPLMLPRRTLQRRLAFLIAENRLQIEGSKRSTRYLAVQPTKTKLPAEQNSGLPVSKAAETIRQKVRGALHTRKPVGYNREFLESYRPNQTAYLSASLRRDLAAAGHTPNGELAAGTYARQIFDRLLIDLSWNSSRLEGNTYSLLETERLLELGESAEGKTARDAQMILNHKAAIEMLVDSAAHIGFNRYTILNLHGLLADNLLANPGAGGRLRAIPVAIGGTVFHPLEVPQLIEECFTQTLATATAIADPFEQAFFVMVHLPYLQPFEDVNKRVSRLAANIPLILLNLCPLSFTDVPERDYIDGILGVYELNRIDLLRDVFVWAYKRSCERYAAVRRSLGEPDPFRLRHRNLLIQIIGEVVRESMDKTAAGAFIRTKLKNMTSEVSKRLIEVAETELLNLHEGNFARYRIRPSEFETWRQSWH